MTICNRKKLFILGILLICVVSFSIGFAAFSTTLNISSSAYVSPSSDDFKLQFVGVAGDDRVPVETTTTVGSTDGKISSDGLSISGMNVVLSKPGDRVAYTVLVKNTGKYDAYVLQFKMSKIGESAAKLKCTPTLENGISDSLLEAACNSINLNYGVYDVETGESLLFDNNKADGLKIPVGEAIRLSISYRYNSDGVYADGDFNVEMGTMSINFSTVYPGDVN